MIIVGLDLSLTSTGVAILAARTGSAYVDRIKSDAPKTERHPRTNKPLPPTLQQRIDRLRSLKNQIADAVPEGARLVLVEGPSMGSKTGHQHDRSGLWWLVTNELDDRGFTVVEIPPSNRMKYATGKGQISKDAVLAAVVRRYPDVEVSGNDEADALVLAAMGARHLGHPIETSLPATHTAAMDNVHWPALEVPTP